MGIEFHDTPERGTGYMSPISGFRLDVEWLIWTDKETGSVSANAEPSVALRMTEFVGGVERQVQVQTQVLRLVLRTSLRMTVSLWVR